MLLIVNWSNQTPERSISCKALPTMPFGGDSKTYSGLSEWFDNHELLSTRTRGIIRCDLPCRYSRSDRAAASSFDELSTEVIITKIRAAHPMAATIATRHLNFIPMLICYGWCIGPLQQNRENDSSNNNPVAISLTVKLYQAAAGPKE